MIILNFSLRYTYSKNLLWIHHYSGGEMILIADGQMETDYSYIPIHLLLKRDKDTYQNLTSN